MLAAASTEHLSGQRFKFLNDISEDLNYNLINNRKPISQVLLKLTEVSKPFKSWNIYDKHLLAQCTVNRFSAGLLTTARSELGEEQVKGSFPPSWEPNGSASLVLVILPPNGSESAVLFPLELNGSSGATAGLVDLEVKGSGPAGAAAVSFILDANRSGSGLPEVVLNGSAEAEKRSSEEKGALEVCVKKLSAAKGSEPLNGSPPKGSAWIQTVADTVWIYNVVESEHTCQMGQINKKMLFFPFVK